MKNDRQDIIRKIANILNDMGYACCRCMNCKTCKKAEEIYNSILANPPVGGH